MRMTTTVPSGRRHRHHAPGRAWLAACMAAALAATLPAPAAAQDVLGVYFDEAATSRIYHTATDDETVRAWLAIRSPSSPSDIAGFCGTVEWDGGGVGWDFAGLCPVAWTPVPTMLMACAEPLPTGETVILGEYTFVVPTPETAVLIYVTQGEGLDPYYVPAASGGEAETVTLHPASGAYTSPVAAINGDDAVPATRASWSGIRALYR